MIKKNKIILLLIGLGIFSNCACAFSINTQKEIASQKLLNNRVIKRDIAQFERYSIVCAREVKIKRRNKNLIFQRDFINILKSEFR